MRSFTIPLSLLLVVLNPYGLVSAVKFPVEVRTDLPASQTLRLRSDTSSNSTLSLANTGNAEYIANTTVGGTTARVIVDTGSSGNFVLFFPHSNYT